MPVTKSRRAVRRHDVRRHLYLEALESRILMSAAQPTVWTPLGVGQGGTSYYANINPLNPNEIYLETDMGEVWHTVDSGLHWTTLNMQTQLSSNNIGNGVQFTSNTNIQYAISSGTTPKVTTDDGQNWTQLAGWAAIQAVDGGVAARLIVDPTNTQRLILMEQKQSGSDYKWWNYYSTDGGTTLTLMNTGGAGASDTTGTDPTENWAAGAFWDGSNITVATNKGLYSSTNGGTSWTFTSSSSLSKPNNASGFDVLSGGTGKSDIISFAASRSGATTRMYAITWDDSYNTMSSTSSGASWYTGLYTSTNGGASWSRIDGTTFGPTQTIPLLIHWVQVADGDISDVWVGGTDMNTSVPIIYKSANDGSTWTRLLKTGGDLGAFPTETANQNAYTRTFGVGDDYNWSYLGHAVTFDVDRSNPLIMTFTAMGTLFGTIDGGANWYDISAGGPNQLANSAWVPEGTSGTRGTAYSNSQANETSIWNLTVIDPNTIFLDSTDVTGELTKDGGATWSYPTVPGVSNPNTFYQSAYVPSTDTLYAVTSNKHDIFTNNIDDGEIEQFGANYLVKSTDHGATWSIIHTFLDGAPARVLAIDPNNPNVAYVGLDNHVYGTGGIYKTTDLQDGASAAWTYLTNQPTRDVDNNGTQDFAGKYISQLSILNDGTLVAVYAVRFASAPEYLSPDGLSYTSGVWVSTDGGNTWSDRSSKDGTGDDIYNSGNNMYDTAGNLLTTETFSVTVDPNDPTQNTWFASTYYFGSQTYGTIYKSTDRGLHWTNWMAWAQNTPHTGVVGQAENLWIQPGGKIMLATTKGGLYYTPDYTAATPIFYPVQNFPFNGSPSFEIASDPFNSNKVYVTTFGGGVWMADVSQLGVAGIAYNPAATTMSATEVMVGWTLTAPTGTGYIIQKSTDQVTWSTAATVPNWQDTSYLVTGLTAATKYYFRILTTDVAGNSLPSTIVSAITDGSSLAAAEEFTQAAGTLNGTGSGTGWSSTWAANSAGDTVVAGGLSPASPPDSAGNSISITSSGVDASRTLTTSVGSANSVTWVSFEVNTTSGSNILLGDSTNGIGFGTQTYSTFPSIIAFHNGTITYHQAGSGMTAGNHFMVARLEYRSDGTVAVRLFLDPTPGMTYPNNEITSWVSGWNGIFTAAQIPTTLVTNKVTLTKPSSGTAKYDEIRIGGNFLAVAPKAGVTAPAAPSGIAGTVIGNNQVNLSWTNNSTNQQGFTIEQFNGSTWSTIERLYNVSSSGTVMNYSITNLAAASTYQFRVSAFNSAGSSATNTTGNQTTLPNVPPAVTNLAVTVSGGQFNLTWGDVAGETGYVLQYADATGIRQAFNDGELPWVTVSPTLAANSTSYSLSTLQTNKLYYFRIYAVNTGGTSTCSNTPSATAFPAPTGLATSPVSDTQVLVSWTENIVGESGYTVQYSANNGGTWTTGATTPANASQAAIAGLSSNTVYLFRVQAFATGSTGSFSSSIVGRTYATLSGQVASDGFNYVAGGGINMNGQGSGTGWTNNWTLSDPADTTLIAGSQTDSNLLTSGNRVQLYTSANATRSLNYTLGQAGTSLWIGFEVNQHLSGGTGSLGSSVRLGNDPNNYIALGSPWNGYYDAIANIAGTTYYMQSGTTPVAAADNTPVFLVYRIDFATGTTGDSVRVWVNPTPGTQPADASANSTWTLATSKHFTFTDSTVRLQGSSYYDQSTFDELRLGTTYGAVAPITLPAPPSGLTAAPGTGNVVLNWTDNSSNELGFDVQRSTDQATWSTVQTTAANVTSWTNTVAAGTYYYRVSSFDGTGDSLPTAVATAVVGGVPAAPSSLAATPGAGSVAFTWTDNSGNESGFHLWRSTDGTNFTDIQTFAANATSGSNTISPGTYYYKLTSYNGTGDSTFSNTVTTTVLAAPTAPSGLSATAISTSQINLAWTDNATNESGFKVYRSTDGSSFSLYQTINTPNTTSYNATGLSAGTQYWFKVTAFNSGGESTYSNTANATTTAVTGLIASDAFGYTSGAGLNGQGTAGSGWAGAWTAPTNATVYATSLTPPVSLQTSGGSIANGTGGGSSTRNLSGALNSSGTTLWTSVLMTPDLVTGSGPFYGRLVVGNTRISYVAESDGTYRWEIDALDGSWYGSHWNSGTNPTVTTGTTYYLVLEQIFNGGLDTVYAWLNPTPGSTAPTTASAFETKTNINAGGTLTNVGFNSSYYSNTDFDELRVGKTFADVAPTSATPPTAPSNLVATPGTSSIGLTWTDNSTGETGFHIYRSTDNSTWGSVYASVGANVTTYTDGAPSAGVGYYYKVTSYNSAGDSTTAAGMTHAIATVIAYDGFNYTVGGGANFDGQSGGVGFTGAWSLSGTANSAVDSGSLAYTSDSSALLESGNSVSLTNDSNVATRTVNYTYGQDNTSLWVGFVMNQHLSGGTGALDSNVQLGLDANNNIQLGSPWDGHYDGQAYIGGTREYWSSSAAAVVDNTPVFLVYRIDFSSASPDKILLWVNPTPGTQPSDSSATATLTLPTGTPHFTFTDSGLKLHATTYYNNTTFDEVRLGASYISVAPDPLLISALLSGMGQGAAMASPLTAGSSDVLVLSHGIPASISILPSLLSSTADDASSLTILPAHGIPVFVSVMSPIVLSHSADHKEPAALYLAGARRPELWLAPDDINLIDGLLNLV